ncbi:MAG: YbaN family protein [Bacteroidales bacterium]|nr:YbaN family protein [Bacteroidales bacterium]
MKIILTILGLLSLTLGIIGIFVPLLPTTPFLLLAAACFFKSSKSLYEKLINSKHLGRYIRDYRENKRIPLRAKVFSLSLLWTSLIYCIFFVASGLLWLQILLAVILVGVTMHIISYES